MNIHVELDTGAGLSSAALAQPLSRITGALQQAARELETVAQLPHFATPDPPGANGPPASDPHPTVAELVLLLDAEAARLRNAW